MNKNITKYENIIKELELKLEKWNDKLSTHEDKEPENPDTKAYEKWEDRLTNIELKIEEIEDEIDEYNSLLEDEMALSA